MRIPHCAIFFPLELCYLDSEGKRDKAVTGSGLGCMKVYRMGNMWSLLDVVAENMLASYVKGLVCV